MNRLQLKITLIGLFLIGLAGSMSAYVDKSVKLKSPSTPTVETRAGDCLPGSSRYDMQINNVRAALLINGDVWWDGTGTGVYIVPKVEPGSGKLAVSSIFQGAVWCGGKDPAGNLKLFGLINRTGTNSDLWPGPLTQNGDTKKATCEQWDKHFPVFRFEIDSAIKLWRKAKLVNPTAPSIDAGLIPDNVKGWPATGNRYFFEVHRFPLARTSQGYGKFHDENLNGIYEPDYGDYPTIDVKGCNIDVYPDEMSFWIYNDNGNVHTLSSRSIPIQMEVQVQAFAYKTNDELNDMTFQRYKLINRANTNIDSMYFAMYVDFDLGCFTDDYIGCDTTRSLAYCYNQDAVDGTNGSTCDQGVNTYGDKIPIIGVDYFRGPNDQFGKELGLSSFTYFLNASYCNPINPMTDPRTAPEFYNYLTGKWKDGTKYTFGGSAYSPGGVGREVKYAFVDAPNNAAGWSMTTANLPCGDRRTIQATGPLKLLPGALNELIIGVPWVPDQKYPSPDIRKLQESDDIAQALFDNCFKIFDGPDAPDLSFVELNQEIVVVMSNNAETSNNPKELYTEPGLKIPRRIGNVVNPDTLYRFEGYKVYQLHDADVGTADLENTDKSRLVAQVDLQNGISKIYNWKAENDPNFPGRNINSKDLKVTGADKGIAHTFKITEDKFAIGDDKGLTNHKKYYFMAITYGYNNYAPFDALKNNGVGQRDPYVVGRRNLGDKDRAGKPYVVIPRPIVNQLLGSKYGDGPVITRVDGVGNGGSFIDINEETLGKILAGTNDGSLVYKPGQGPINVKVYTPIEVVDGNYTLEMKDGDLTDDILDVNAKWQLKRDGDAGVTVSDTTLETLNEQVIAKYGFSIAIAQVKDAGKQPTVDKTNGAIGSTVQYKNSGTPWLTAVQEDVIIYPFLPEFLNYLKNQVNEPDFDLDPKQAMGKINPNYLFVPYSLADYRDVPNVPFLTPAWVNSSSSGVRQGSPLSNLNNVNIVFTSDKSKWSRCVVVETAVPYYYDNAAHPQGINLPTADNIKQFDLRKTPSVGKNALATDPNKAAPEVLPTDVTPDGIAVTKGKGWFPGYAVDVETGERLNIFFGENSVFDPAIGKYDPASVNINRDMIFNPSPQAFLPTDGGFDPAYAAFMGGQHYVYVTRTKYDGCSNLSDRLSGSSLRKIGVMKEITWAGMIMVAPNQKMLSYKDGLIPNDVTVSLRVNNPYAPLKGKGTNGNHPAYKFSLNGSQAKALTTATQIDSALNFINVVPNPYYGFSAYEITEFSTTVKMTNLPPKCNINIYTLDGKFIRQFRRDEAPIRYVEPSFGTLYKQITPDLEWDMKNDKGIPVSSGVYLIHVDAGELGQRTLKFFAINRQFDPSRL